MNQPPHKAVFRTRLDEGICEQLGKVHTPILIELNGVRFELPSYSPEMKAKLFDFADELASETTRRFKLVVQDHLRDWSRGRLPERHSQIGLSNGQPRANRDP